MMELDIHVDTYNFECYFVADCFSRGGHESEIDELLTNVHGRSSRQTLYSDTFSDGRATTTRSLPATELLHVFRFDQRSATS